MVCSTVYSGIHERGREVLNQKTIMLLKYLPKEKIVEIPDNLKELTEQLASAVMNLDIQMEHEIVKKLREEIKTT